MYRKVIFLVLFSFNLEIECCKPELFKYIKIVEKLVHPTPKTNKWKEVSFYNVGAINTRSLIIANDELPSCRMNIEEYERGLVHAAAIEIHLHKIPVLRNGDIQNLKISKINLQDNNIEKIEPGAFQNLERLEIINLGDNDIKEILTDVFNNFTMLERIDLTNNNIDRMDPDAFDNINNLKEIYLGNNKLANWDPKWFTNTPSLKYLKVNYNELKNIPAHSFDHFKNALEKIDLSYNQLEEIHSSLFHNAEKLNFLGLKGNKLKCFSEDVLKSFPQDLTLGIGGNLDIDCSCLVKIQKFALENKSFNKDTIVYLERYIQVKCNEQILGMLENVLKRISVLEGKS